MQKRISVKLQPIKNAAGLKGADIGKIGIGTKVWVDEEHAEKDDRKTTWVPIVGPDMLGPTWMKTGQQGWIELANTVLQGETNHQYLLEIDSDGDIVSFKQIS